MSGPYKGRSITLTWKGSPIAKMRTKGVSIANEPIDVTSDSDDGWRNQLSEAGERQINISVAGIVVNDTLRKAAIGTNISGATVMTWPDGSSLTGTFNITSYNENGEYNGAIAFEAELQSIGPVIHDSATG